MTDAILVLNAGSSSLKFSVFAVGGSNCESLLRGQVEGLGGKPRFVARDQAGEVVGTHEWTTGEQMGHEAAIQFLLAWGREGPLAGRGIVTGWGNTVLNSSYLNSGLA